MCGGNVCQALVPAVPARPDRPECLSYPERTRRVSIPKIIFSAYFAVPAASNAEGVVTDGWLRALSGAARCAVATSASASLAADAAAAELEGIELRALAAPGPGDGLTGCLAAWTQHPRWTPTGLTGRALDWTRHRCLGWTPLHMHLWSRAAARQILAWAAGDFVGATVWARGVPVDSFEAALRAHRQRPFPLVVNYSDAMPRRLLDASGSPMRWRRGIERIEHARNQALARTAQAFVFSSRRLGDLMLAHYGFAPDRCFVIPHVAPVPDVPAALPAVTGRPAIVYAGSLYPSVFGPAVRAGIEAYLRRPEARPMHWLIKSGAAADRQWLAGLPSSTVTLDMPPDRCWRELQQAGAVLLADAPHHGPLLLTKVVEGLASGRPLLALTWPGSTTEAVVRAAGGIVVHPDSAEDVVDGFLELERRLAAGAAASRPDQARERVLDRFRGPRVAADVIAVAGYAQRRFAWECRKDGVEPEPPAVERWP